MKHKPRFEECGKITHHIEQNFFGYTQDWTIWNGKGQGFVTKDLTQARILSLLMRVAKKLKINPDCNYK